MFCIHVSFERMDIMEAAPTTLVHGKLTRPCIAAFALSDAAAQELKPAHVQG